MTFPIIYEDDNTLVIDKSAGIMVHPDDRSEEETVADWLLLHFPNITSIGEEGRYGIVHRLDRNTTGVLIMAKTHKAYRSFKTQFKNHTTRKVYRAIVEGNIKDDIGMISASLARAKSDFRKRTVVDMFSLDARGEEKEAITRYKVLARSKDDTGNAYTYVEVYPVTGRTHQIRAHFRGIRHPIVGDDLYGSRLGKDISSRSMLHAISLTLEIPEKGEMTFEAPIPEDMKETLVKLNFSC